MPDLYTPQTLEAEKHEVARLLEQFMTEMNQWELSCLRALDHLDLASGGLASKEAEFKSDLDRIYNKYCTLEKRKYTHLGSYGNPPIYDPRTEKIVDMIVENRNRMIVLSQRDIGLITQYKYVVLRRNEKWLIDSRARLDRNGKWQSAIL
jgi:NTF2 fold immunity protein